MACTEFHKFLSPKKLIDIGMAYLPEDKNIEEYVKSHKMIEKKKVEVKGNIRRMEKKDIPQVYQLFTKQQE